MGRKKIRLVKVKVILSHSGKQHSYHVAKALDELGHLEKFYTSGYIRRRALQQLTSYLGNHYWSRRFIGGIHGGNVESNWRFEIKENLYNRFFGQSTRTTDAVFDRDVQFDAYISKKMHRLRGEIFWGFQGSCYNSIKTARQQGKLTICELSGVHAPKVIRLLQEEATLHPEWRDSIESIRYPDFYYDRIVAEPELAEIVVAASPFTIRSLEDQGIPAEKIKLLPLGFEAEVIPFREEAQHAGPLRIAYVGRITQSKGIKYLLEAIKLFSKGEVELHLIGYEQGSKEALYRYKDHFIKHGPMEQYQLFRKYGEFDALVLPSICEGFGLVILEALAAGLPVITTPHTIGPEIICNGQNGYIVPVRDAPAIAGAIGELLAKSHDELSAMRAAARSSALAFSWTNYKLRLKALLGGELTELYLTKVS